MSFRRNNRVLPWDLPFVMISSISNVMSTLILICVFMGGFAVMGASGMFDAYISWLCLKFRGRESWLLALIMSGFACMGLFVMPHCFIAFIPTMIILARAMGYDALVGLAVVLFGATTASMTGPFGAVTAMSQDAVGLPIYSGAGVRFLLFIMFHVINVIYLIRYANRIKKNPSRSYVYGMTKQYEQEEGENASELDLKPGLKKEIFLQHWLC